MKRQQPIVIPMEDPIIHTVEKPVCDDPTCICAHCEYELLRTETATPLRRRRRRVLVESKPKGTPHDRNRPFSFLR